MRQPAAKVVLALQVNFNKEVERPLFFMQKKFDKLKNFCYTLGRE